jgi:hypothetical protein
MLALWGRKPCFRPRVCEAMLRTGKAGARLPQSKEQQLQSWSSARKIPDSIRLVQQCCITGKLFLDSFLVFHTGRHPYHFCLTKLSSLC